MNLKKTSHWYLFFAFVMCISLTVPQQLIFGEGGAANLSSFKEYKPPGREYSVYLLACELEGKKYKSGGNTPAGFDTSGFVQYVYKKAIKMDLPRKVSDQYKLGTPIKTSELSLGDLVFFKTNGKLQCVGISWGTTFFVVTKKKGVTQQSLDTPYWKKRFVGARRVIHPSSEACKYFKGHFESAKKGMLLGCEFGLGAKKEQIIEKWGLPQDKEDYVSNDGIEIDRYIAYKDKEIGRIIFWFDKNWKVESISVVKKHVYMEENEIEKILGKPDHTWAHQGLGLTYKAGKNELEIFIANSPYEDEQGTHFSIGKRGK